MMGKIRMPRIVWLSLFSLWVGLLMGLAAQGAKYLIRNPEETVLVCFAHSDHIKSSTTARALLEMGKSKGSEAGQKQKGGAE